ncbi:hypothetical protein V3C99_016033 [Haemonchus contortus]
MFFILAALALSIPTVTNQESPFSTSALEELKSFSGKYFGDNWSEELSERALQWMTKNASKMAKLSYKGRRCFLKPRGEMPVEFNKVASKFAIPFENQNKKVTASLRTGVNYGCNGLLDKKNEGKDCVIVGCLFSTKH